MTDWTEMRRLYQQGGITYKELARRFGVSPATVCRRIREEGWDKRPGDDLSAAAECLSRAVLKALGDTHQFYVPAKTGEEKLDIKSVKEMTAVLRDLASLRQTLREDGAPAASDDANTLRVVLEGEADQWSQ